MVSIITIDGPVRSGKSSVAKKIAEKCDIFHLNTGLIYRAAAWLVLEANLNPRQEIEKVVRLIREVSLDEIRFLDSSCIYFAGHELDDNQLRSARVIAATPWISNLDAVRWLLLPPQQRVGQAHASIVAEGRDTGTVVFPDAAAKFYLTVSDAERRRRAIEKDGHEAESTDKDRDRMDRLTPATGAVIIDTSRKPIDQVVAEVINHLGAKGALV